MPRSGLALNYALTETVRSGDLAWWLGMVVLMGAARPRPVACGCLGMLSLSNLDLSGGMVSDSDPARRFAPVPEAQIVGRAQHWRGEHAVVWSLRLRVAHAACWRLSSAMTGHALLYSSRSMRASGLTWSAAPVARSAVSVAWGSVSRNLVVARAVWGTAPVIRQTESVAWGTTAHIRLALPAKWSAVSLRARQASGSGWGSAIPVHGGSAATWALRTAGAVAVLSARWECSESIRFMSAMSLRWSLPGGTIVELPEIALQVAGNWLPLESCELRQEIGVAQATAIVTPLVLPAALPAPGTPVVLRVGCDDWQMLVSSGDGEASSPVNAGGTMQLVSPCEPLGRAEPVALPFGGMASQVAAAAVAPLALVWEMVDWYLPPPVVATLADLPPLEVAQRLAKAAGGFLVSAPSGALTARCEGGNLRLLGEALESDRSASLPEYRGVVVRPQALGASIQVSGSGQSRTVDVVPTPWRVVETRIFGDGSTSVSPLAEVVRETTEQVQIIDGVGATQYPVVRIIKADWNDGADRALRHQGQGVWAEAGLNSLCTVTYEYRALSVTVQSGQLRDALAAVYELF